MSCSLFTKRLEASCPSMELQVHGCVKLDQGGATISLAPLIGPPPPSRATPPAPNPDMVTTWDIHPSRKPITREVLTQAILLVQKQMSFPSGLRRGGWSPEATERLKLHLRKPMRGAAHEEDEGPPKKTLCLDDQKPLLALQDADSSPRAKPGKPAKSK